MKNNLLLLSSRYIYLTIALVITFWLSSLFEVYRMAIGGLDIPNLAAAVIYKLANDLWTGFLIGLLFIPVYFLFSLLKRSFGDWFVKNAFYIDCPWAIRFSKIQPYHIGKFGGRFAGLFFWRHISYGNCIRINFFRILPAIYNRTVTLFRNRLLP